MEIEQYTSNDPLNELMLLRGEIDEVEEILLPLRERIVISQMFNQMYLNDSDYRELQ